MKKVCSFAIFFAVILVGLNACAQDKSKRQSPPAKVTETINTGAAVTIDYSQPALKGRTIGKDVEPMDGKVWRAGANEATVFQVSKNVKVEGHDLPAGKYSFFTIKNGNDWTLIFNKKWDIWGTDYEKNKSEDALKAHVKGTTSSSAMERLTYTVSKNGKVSLIWGTMEVDFNVQ